MRYVRCRFLQETSGGGYPSGSLVSAPICRPVGRKRRGGIEESRSCDSGKDVDPIRARACGEPPWDNDLCASVFRNEAGLNQQKISLIRSRSGNLISLITDKNSLFRRVGNSDENPREDKYF